MVKNILFIFGGIAALGALYFVLFRNPSVQTTTTQAKPSSANTNTSSQNTIVTIVGEYVCLPLAGNGTGSTADCAYGIKTTDGAYYAVNYDKAAGYMDQFVAGQKIEAQGYITTRENLRPDRWTKFSMSGLFTITVRPVVK